MKHKRKPLPFAEISFMTDHEAGKISTDSLGKFSIHRLQLYKNEKVKLFVNENKDKKISITASLLKNEAKDSIIIVPERISFSPIKLKERISIIEDDFESYLNIYKSRELLDEVVLFAKKNKDQDDNDDAYVNPMDKTTFVKSFYVNDKNVTDFASVLSYLRSQSGIRVAANPESVKIYSLRAMSQRLEKDTRPLDVYLNNTQMQQYEIDQLDYLDLTQVKSIKVNPSGIGHGARSPFGVISIYTRGKPIFKKVKNNKSISSSISFTARQGYEIKKEYYTPDYIYLPKSDYYKKYATIHWQPEISLSKASVNFSSVIPKEIEKCVVLIEGVSASGHIISSIKEITIK